jgi:hypothetical protein
MALISSSFPTFGSNFSFQPWILSHIRFFKYLNSLSFAAPRWAGNPNYLSFLDSLGIPMTPKIALFAILAIPLLNIAEDLSLLIIWPEFNSYKARI